jgi:hypothetical protein
MNKDQETLLDFIWEAMQTNIPELLQKLEETVE